MLHFGTILTNLYWIYFSIGSFLLAKSLGQTFPICRLTGKSTVHSLPWITQRWDWLKSNYRDISLASSLCLIPSMLVGCLPMEQMSLHSFEARTHACAIQVHLQHTVSRVGLLIVLQSALRCRRTWIHQGIDLAVRRYQPLVQFIKSKSI